MNQKKIPTIHASIYKSVSFYLLESFGVFWMNDMMSISKQLIPIQK